MKKSLTISLEDSKLKVSYLIEGESEIILKNLTDEGELTAALIFMKCIDIRVKKFVAETWKELKETGQA